MIDRSLDIEAQTRALLEPGDIDLVGAIVDTDLRSDSDLEMMDATLEVGDRIAGHLTDEPTYIYSGNDDDRFASNQHQCLTVDDDGFVWECQQLLADGTFTLVYYFEATGALDAIVADIESGGYRVTGVRP